MKIAVSRLQFLRDAPHENAVSSATPFSGYPLFATPKSQFLRDVWVEINKFKVRILTQNGCSATLRPAQIEGGINPTQIFDSGSQNFGFGGIFASQILPTTLAGNLAAKMAI